VCCSHPPPGGRRNGPGEWFRNKTITTKEGKGMRDKGKGGEAGPDGIGDTLPDIVDKTNRLFVHQLPLRIAPVIWRAVAAGAGRVVSDYIRLSRIG